MEAEEIKQMMLRQQEAEEKMKFNALQKVGSLAIRTGKILHDKRTETERRTILEVTPNKRYCVVYMEKGEYTAIFYAQNELTLLLNHF